MLVKTLDFPELIHETNPLKKNLFLFSFSFLFKFHVSIFNKKIDRFAKDNKPRNVHDMRIFKSRPTIER